MEKQESREKTLLAAEMDSHNHLGKYAVHETEAADRLLWNVLKNVLKRDGILQK